MQSQSQFIQNVVVAESQSTRCRVSKGFHNAKDDLTSTEYNLKSHFDGKLRDIHSQKEQELRVLRLLGSLDFELRNARYNTITDSHEITFEWIYDVEPSSNNADQKDAQTRHHSKSFVSWLSSDEPLFWVSGKPGSGKSTLMKFLRDHQRTQELLRKNDSSAFIISVFIWNAGSPQERSLQSVIASLLYSLLKHRPDVAYALLSRSESLLHKKHISQTGL